MTIYVDTSAFLSVLDADDGFHAAATETWKDLLNSEATLLVTNYILLETVSLVQHRLGVRAARSFHEDIVPLLQVVWLDETAHNAGIAHMLAAGRRHLSLVDCASFHVMRRLGLRTAFTLDRHFAREGFQCIPR